MALVRVCFCKPLGHELRTHWGYADLVEAGTNEMAAQERLLYVVVFLSRNN